jgi:hypothetical protein
VAMQVDVGFGDVITPDVVAIEYPTLLEFPAPRLTGYPRETVVAEKFEAMVKLGLLNSRMKDFYDLWVLGRQFPFDGPTVVSAVRRTFANRGTGVVPVPTALTGTFANDPAKQAQWTGFLRKSRLEGPPGDLPAVVAALAAFLLPVAEAASGGGEFNWGWEPPGPWYPRD